MITTVKQETRYRVHQILETAADDDRVSRLCDLFLISLILLNVIAFVLGSVDWIADGYGAFLDGFEVFSIAVFTIEYLLRIWASVEHLPLRGLPHWRARLRFALQPFQLIDLIAILPFYMASLVGADLRLLRLLRLFRFLKIMRYSAALQVIVRVFYNEGRALLASLMIMVGLLLIASTGMHYLEHEVQPETFGDIPSSMWWALSTLTTVGYGDAVPVTGLGQIWSGLFMVFGLGMFALPIGIISTGFSQELRRREFVVNWTMVARVPLFNRLDAAEVAEIMRLLQSQRLPAASLISREGDEVTGLYFIVSGEVEISRGETVEILSDGDFFGESCLLTGSNSLTARAVTEVNLLLLERSDFDWLLRQDPGLSEHIKELSIKSGRPA